MAYYDRRVMTTGVIQTGNARYAEPGSEVQYIENSGLNSSAKRMYREDIERQEAERRHAQNLAGTKTLSAYIAPCFPGKTVEPDEQGIIRVK